MNRFRTFTATLVLAFALLLSGCGESPLQPSAPEAPSSSDAETQAVSASIAGLPAALIGGGSSVTVAQRNHALSSDLVQTKTIHPTGGFIHIWGAGFTLYFPAGAVSEPTEITVTAPAGDLVGYHMEPHGIEFPVPVVAVQSLWGTNAFGRLDLTAAYFGGTLSPVISALEILPLRAPALPWFAVFRIDHFSGYVVAWD